MSSVVVPSSRARDSSPRSHSRGRGILLWRLRAHLVDNRRTVARRCPGHRSRKKAAYSTGSRTRRGVQGFPPWRRDWRSIRPVNPEQHVGLHVQHLYHFLTIVRVVHAAIRLSPEPSRPSTASSGGPSAAADAVASGFTFGSRPSRETA